MHFIKKNFLCIVKFGLKIGNKTEKNIKNRQKSNETTKNIKKVPVFLTYRELSYDGY